MIDMLCHGLLGLLYAGILLPFLPPIYAVALVGVFFYGREVGQYGHDLTGSGVNRVRAWARSLVLDFKLALLVQAMIPLFTAIAAALIWQAWAR